MSETVKQFFAELESKVDPAKTAGMNNSYVFDVAGAGQWTVRVSDGQVKVTEGAEQTDVTISASAETFERIANGQQNPTTAAPLNIRQMPISTGPIT